MTSHEPDAIDCSHALMQAYQYLDGEMGPDDCAKIREHLAQCGPCMDEYDIDQMLKTQVSPPRGSESAPTQMRRRNTAGITPHTAGPQARTPAGATENPRTPADGPDAQARTV